MKKLLSMLLILALLLSLAPTGLAEEGTVSVWSDPAGADVYIDGELYRPAVTPCEVPLTGGEHSLSVRMAGYDPYETEVRAGDSVSVHLATTVPEGPNVRRLVVAWDDWGPASANVMTWENYDKFINRQEPDWDWEDPDYVEGAYDLFTHYGEGAIGVTLREALCIAMNDTGWYDEENGVRWHYLIEFAEGKDEYMQTANINCFGRGTGSWMNGEELFIRYTPDGAYEDLEAKANWSHDGCFTINGDRDRDGVPDVTLYGWDSWGWDGRWGLNLLCSDAHVVGVNFAQTMHVSPSVPFWQPKNYFHMSEIYITGCTFEGIENGVGRFFGLGGGGSIYGTSAEGYGQPGASDLDGFYITGCEFQNEQIGIIAAGGDMDYARAKNLVIQGNHIVNGVIFVRNVDAHTWYLWYNSNAEMSGTMYGEDCIGVAEHNILEDVTISGNTLDFTVDALGGSTYDGSYGNVLHLGNSNLGGSHNTMRNVTVRCNRSTLEQGNIDAYEWYPNAGIGIGNAAVGEGKYESYPSELASQLTEVSDNLFDGLTVEYNDFRINYFDLENISLAGTAQVGVDNYFRNISITNNRIQTVKGLHFYGASGTSNPGTVASGALENLTVADNRISVLRKTGWGPDSNINSSGEQDDYGILLCGASIADYDGSNWDESGEEAPWETLDVSVSGVTVARNTINGFANGLMVVGAQCDRTHYVTDLSVSDVTIADNVITTDGLNQNCRNDGISLIAAIDGGVGCTVGGVTVSGNTVTANNGLLAAGFFSRGTSRFGVRDNQVLGVTASGNRFVYQAPNENGGFPILTADVACTWGEVPYELGANAVELTETDNSAEGFAWGSMKLSELSRKGVSDPEKFLEAVQRCSDEAVGSRYIDWSMPGEGLFMGVCDQPNFRPGNCHRYYLCPAAVEPEGFRITVTDKTGGGAAASLDPEALYSGEVEFTVSSEKDQAVLVAVKNVDEYTVLPCTDADGCHCFTLNIADDTELVLAFKGDVDLNGEVKLKDNLMVKKHIARSELITDPLALLVADTDGNGEVKLKDNLMIKKHIARSELLRW